MKNRQEYDREYRLRNKDIIKAKRQIYYQANRDEYANRSKSYYIANKDEVAEQKRKWYIANKDKVSVYSKYRNKKYKGVDFGLAVGEYSRMLEGQNGVCKICGQGETRIRFNTTSSLVIDHNHDTGEVRGLLCNRCNVGLGCFKDDISLLRRATEYLDGNEQ
jgi:hypothetical protein